MAVLTLPLTRTNSCLIRTAFSIVILLISTNRRLLFALIYECLLFFTVHTWHLCFYRCNVSKSKSEERFLEAKVECDLEYEAMLEPASVNLVSVHNIAMFEEPAVVKDGRSDIHMMAQQAVAKPKPSPVAVCRMEESPYQIMKVGTLLYMGEGRTHN